MAADRIELILDRAMDFATERSHEYVTLEHLLLSVLQEPPVHKIIEQLKINIDDITTELLAYVDNDMGSRQMT